MNTTVHNPALHRLHGVTKTQQAEAKPEVKPSTTTSLAEFNSRAGVKPEHLKSVRGGAPNRLGQLASLRRSAQANKAMHSKKNLDDDDLFGSETSQLMDVLQRGGEGALKDWMSQRHDPLEQHELLEYALDKSSGKDKDALSRVMDELKSKHGKTIASALEGANEFKTALHKMDALSNGGAQAGLRKFRTLFNSGNNHKLDGPSSALTLARRIRDMFGTAHFADALKEMRSQLGSQMRTTQGAKLDARIWLSMSDASSFRLMQSVFAIGCELRRNLSDIGIIPDANEGDVALELINSVENAADTSDMIVNIAGQKQEQMQQAAAARLISRAVEALPITLWADRLSERMNLISELRLRGGSADETEKPRESKEAKLERRLREELALLTKSRKAAPTA